MSEKRVEPNARANLKIVPFNIRVSESEKSAFADAAELSGIPLSSWVRERLRVAAKRELIEAGRQVPFLQNAVARDE